MNLKAAIAAEKMLIKLRQQADEYGKIATEIQRLNLMRTGATQNQLAEFDAIQKNIQVLKQAENQTNKLRIPKEKRKQTFKNIIHCLTLKYCLYLTLCKMGRCA